MPDITTVLADVRAAVDDFLATADRCESRWTTPRAKGKWSPSQVVEHVARALDESADMVAGKPNRFPSMPSFVRPLARALFFKPTVRKRSMMKAKTFSFMDPDAGPSTPADARARIEGALDRFEEACRRSVAAGKPAESSIFGRISVEDYAIFQAVHTRHHHAQLEVSAEA